MRISLKYIILTFSLTLSAWTQTTWQWVNPLPQGHLLNAVKAVNASLIYAVGEYGTIIRSTNGGTTWQVTPTAAGMIEGLYDVDFPTSNAGIAVGVTGQIVQTMDGGDTWYYDQLPTIRDLLSIKFSSPTHGWISGGAGIVFSTTDGGTTWNPETTGVTANLYDIFFIDALNGWTVGASGTILHSSDGGNSWTAQTSGTTQPLYSVHFVTASVGYASGAFGKVYKTLNGGASWSPLVTDVAFGLYKVYFSSALTGWASGSFGSIIKTTNGGVSWFEQSSGTYNDIYSLSFVSSTTGFGVGDFGTIVKTTDGGATWSLISTGTKNYIFGIHFPSPVSGFAVGEEGTYAKSSDGGYTWTEVFTGIFQDYYGVWFNDNATGWIVGDSAVILKTTNAGVSWNDQNSRSEETLNSIFFLNADRGWAVGDFGTILATTNGGSSWNAQTVASFGSFLKIRFLDQNTGWVVGYSGEIFKTTDGGASWVEQFSGTSQAIYALQIIDANTVYAAGDFGTLLKTTNGGQNWQLIPNDFFESFYGIAFSSATTGWAVGDEGAVIMTTNGGASWSWIRSGTYQTLFDVQLVRPSNGGGLLFAAGEGGTIICSAVTPLPVRQWTGAFDSLWTNPSNWNPVGLPGKSDSAYIPLTAHNPVIRSTAQQFNVGAVRVGTGAKLSIRSGVAEFVVKGNMNVDGTLELDPGGTTNIVVGGSFVVGGLGIFTNGRSTVVMNGSGLISGRFHNLIVGDSVRLQTVGDVTIDNSLLLLSDMTLRSVDTLTILNPDPYAYQGIGGNYAGTVRRVLTPGSTATYRFGSPATWLRFEPTGTIPSSVSITTYPRTLPPGQGDSVFVRRWYDIKPAGGNNFLTSLSLLYDSVETSIPTDNLSLFRDSGNIIVNMGQSDYLDSDLVAIILDSVRSFSRWYIGDYDFIPSNQFQFQDSLIISDNGGITDTIYFGAYPGATDGIDTILDEKELPPPHEPGSFDARWVIPPTEGSRLDLKDILTILHTQNIYTVRLQPGPAGYPMTIQWDHSGYPPGTFTLRDKATGGAQFSVDMKKQNSYVVTIASVSEAEIVHDGPEFFAFNSGWNIISLPLRPTGTKSKTLIFPSATSKAFYFNNAYYAADSLDAGVGYWLKFPGALQVGIDGDTVFSDTIPVNAGWNMIGSITNPVSVSSVVQQPPGNVTSSYYGYGTGYVAASTLQPARGYWVKVSSPGQLVLSSTGSLPKGPDLLPAPWRELTSMTEIAVTDRRGSSQSLYLGTALPPDASRDLYELPPLPPGEVFDLRFASNLAVETIGSDGSASAVLLQGAKYPVTLSVSFPAGATGSLDVVNAATGELIASGIRPGTPLILRDPSVTTLGVTISGYTEIPREYALEQNYPNPFNPATTIAFDVPAPSRVTVRVFDLLGQEVARPVDGRHHEPGRYRTVFRADGFATGLYFYRLEATDDSGRMHSFTKKMMLLK